MKKLKHQLGDKPHKCGKCPARFKNSSALHDHEVVHSEERSHICPYAPECSYKSKSPKTLSVHVKAIHLKLKPHSCPHCDYKCSNPGSMKQHVKIHTGEDLIQCQLCDYKTGFLANMKRHMSTHTGERHHKCELNNCDYAAHTRSQLKAHQRKKHGTGKELSFPCPEEGCRFEGAISYDLEKHRKQVHLKLKPYKCGICKGSFGSQPCLENHLRTHTGEKPFPCDKCDFSSSFHGSLRDHKLSFHNEGKRTLECPECDASFKTRASLRDHLPVHKGSEPFKCDKCDFGSRSKRGLRLHGRAHSEGQVYDCEHCDFTTRYQSTVKRHIREVHKL